MLSQEQQQLILEYQWIINTVCKKLCITDADIRSELTLFMCQTIEKYDQTKGVKLGTYLYSSVYLRALRLLKYYYKYQNKNVLTPIMLSGECRTTKTHTILYQSIRTPEERQIITYTIQGYKNREIAHLMGIKPSQVKQIYVAFTERLIQEHQNEPKINN